MDAAKVVEILRATLQPDQRQDAEKQLDEIHKIIGFVPILLQVVMSDQVDVPVRQAGVIYLKNMVCQFWEEKEPSHPTEVVPFCVHDQDRQLIRDNIVEAVIQAPQPIRVQLAVCISHMVKHDYPGKWPGIAEKVAMYLQSDAHDTWMGALICLYQLVKNFEYKKPEDRLPLNQAMQHILPIIHQRCMQMMPDQSELAVLLQKQILKVFFALIQFHLPQDMLTKEIFTQWMELVRQCVDKPIPEATLQVDEEDRPELAWWKCKKWALHILARCFERYGSPGNVSKEYNNFANWYLKAFSGGMLQVLLKLLDQYRNKMYVSPRVMQQTLNYLHIGVSHAVSWKIIKPHMMTVVQEIVFPLMCHNDEDQELWETDPVEYIRIKYDVFEEFFSPVSAAQTLLHTAVSKRKEVLQKTMGFIMSILSSETAVDPRQKAGALNMVGAVAEILLQKKIYKDQAEAMLVRHVFPEFASEHGYLRARACWVLNHFSEVKFKQADTLEKSVELTRNAMCVDKELPVRVEAAIALQMLMTNQDKAKDVLLPHLGNVVLELLKIIRETESDDLTSVMQKIVCIYREEIAPLAVEICTHLAETFAKVLESSGENSDEKAIVAMGILNTLDTIVTVMEEHKEIVQQIEGVVLNVIAIILQENVIEFYDELLTLIYSLTSQFVSDRMWNVFPKIYDLFKNDGFDYFADMMPALHNYITVDPDKFLANPRNMEIIYEMCKTIMTMGDSGEDAECHAAKLLEILLLQFKGKIDQLVPLFVNLALERLTREVRTSELRTMCLQVVVTSLYYNPSMLFEMLEKIHMPNSTEPITAQFLKQWLHDTDCFLGLHDRKICVLGLCTLMDTAGSRPQVITDISQQILPACILLFDGLKRAYQHRAEQEEDDSDEDEEYEEGELDDEDDVIDETGQQYLEKLERSVNGEDDSSDDEDEDYESEETALESYETPLDKDDSDVDEYQIFRSILTNLEQGDQAWYQSLTNGLTEDQRKEIMEIFKLAEQRRAAQESKKIEQHGGYMFTQTQVPVNFNFGGAAPSP